VTLTQSNTFLFTASSSDCTSIRAHGTRLHRYRIRGESCDRRTSTFYGSIGIGRSWGLVVEFRLFLGQTAAQIGTANYTLQSFDLNDLCAGVDPADSEFGWGADRTRSMGKNPGLHLRRKWLIQFSSRTCHRAGCTCWTVRSFPRRQWRTCACELARPKHVDPANRNTTKHH